MKEGGGTERGRVGVEGHTLVVIRWAILQIPRRLLLTAEFSLQLNFIKRLASPQSGCCPLQGEEVDLAASQRRISWISAATPKSGGWLLQENKLFLVLHVAR